MSVEIIHGDCMEYMAGLPDGAFDLAIVDPPYGLEVFKTPTPNSRVDRSQRIVGWDRKPDADFFSALFRVARYVVIWGANNFTLPPSEYFIVWDKAQTVDNFASAEYAWTNCKMPAKVFHYSIHQTMQDRLAEGGKIHPTQKPVALYRWLLHNYAKPGWRILDTHLGSGSSAIAAHEMGFDFVGIEIDADYIEAARKRFDLMTRQQTLDL